MNKTIIERTEDKELIASYLDIREEVFLKDTGSTSYYGNNKYNNKHDKSSIFIIARNGDQVIGGIRIVIPNEANDYKLPMEEELL
ncbi:hypothetical protein PN36_15555 [Candidatus Thiomargarita nelsonii]|uniref:Acetyltransferase n=1 Tax=Candidatus Thiomargarita nelsonii TaxID=1003181 RepID=A0A0A6P244_9GAMM|nr:hypothetical protein PN36_15555 [Candidatus Thiomargarita nelsonii]